MSEQSADNTVSPRESTPPRLGYATRGEESFANPDATGSIVLAWMFVPILLLTFLFGWDALPLTFFVWPICSIVAICLGVSGLGKSRLPNTGGRNLSRAGIIVGVAGLVVFVGVFILIFAAINNGIDRAIRVKCASNLRQIGQAVLSYSKDNDGRFPDHMGLLITREDLNPEVFVCQASKDVVVSGSTAQQAASLSTPGYCSYVYLGKGMTMPVSSKVILAYERLENHEKAGMNVLYGDGHAEWMGAKEAERVLAELKAGHNPPRGVGK